MESQWPSSSMHDTLEITKKKFIGKPLKALYKNHSYSRKSFVLFLENADGSGRRRLGEDPNLSLLIKRNSQYSGFSIKDICRYYDQIHVVINPPKEET